MTVLEPTSMTLELPITLRTATKSDLSKLEWFGLYKHFRPMFARLYKDQLQGTRIMLLADYNGFPIGHVFIQLVGRNKRIANGRDHAYFHSFRVMEMFRGQGIGTWLISEAESIIYDYGFSFATISVAKDNIGAHRLYHKLGYEVFASDPGRWSYVDHKGKRHKVNEPCWVMEKFLG